MPAIPRGYLSGYVAAIRPPPSLTVSECADRYYVLDSVSSSEPGPWVTDRMPHLREIMDCLGTEHPAEKVVAMMASQTGKSSIALAWILYTIIYDPCPFLLVEPDVLRSEEFSKTRVDPMIEACPELRSRVAGDAGKRKSSNTLHLKLFPGGKLLQVGANSPSGLASNPIKRAIWDERDRSKAGAKGEGAQDGLITARQTTYPDRKLFICSSPTTTADGTIWHDWLASDQRHRMVPCPHCHGDIELQWEQLRWTAGDPASVYYECDLCGCEIREHHKSVMLGDDCGAHWVASNPSSAIPGFTCSCLYLPLGWYGWGNLVADYETAIASGDPEKMKAWANTRLARTFDDRDDYGAPDGWDDGRSEVWKARVPAGVAVLCAGVDVHEGRLEVEVTGWGMGETSWSVDFRVLPGDPGDPPVWADLDAYLATAWPCEGGGSMRVMATCVDTGGHRTQAAYVQTTKRLGSRVWGIRGSKVRESPIWPLKSRKAGGQYVVFEVGVHAIKDRVIPRLKLLPNMDADGKVTGYPPGYCHVPDGRGAEWFAQMRAEVKRVVIIGGRQVGIWKQIRDRNEALDCRVYSYAALHSLYAAGWTLERLLDERLLQGQPVVARTAPVAKRESRMDRYRNGGRG